ncbi:MAG: hypothetical protein U0T73_14050 [Chitinophagales bacterium]
MKIRLMAAAVMIMMIAGMESCSTKSCSKVTCGLNQVCNNGQCFCNNGYEGDSCNKLSYPKFIGTYFVNETCNGTGGSSYTAYITQGSTDVSSLDITNFLGQFTVRAYIRSTVDKKGTYLEIPDQTLGGTSDNMINGQGNFEYVGAQQRIVLNVNYRLNSTDRACSHVFYKQ